MSQPNFKNYKNEVNNSRRIFAVEDLDTLSSNEFRQLEKIIDYQVERIGLPTRDQLAGSPDTVYVKEYTRSNGTAVKAHYRAKPGRTPGSGTPQDNNRETYDGDWGHNPNNKPYNGGENPIPEQDFPSEEEEAEERLKGFARVAVSAIYPDDYDNIVKELDIEEKEKPKPQWQKEIEEKYEFAKKSVELIGQKIQNMPDSKFKMYLMTSNMAASKLVGGLEAMEIQQTGGQPGEMLFNQMEGMIAEMSDAICDIKEHGFGGANWSRIASRLGAKGFLSMVHPALGLVATVGLDIVPNVIKMNKAYGAGDLEAIYEGMTDLADGMSALVFDIANAAESVSERVSYSRELKETQKTIKTVKAKILEVEDYTTNEYAKAAVINTGLKNDFEMPNTSLNNLGTSETKRTTWTQTADDFVKGEIVDYDPSDPRHAQANEYKELCNRADDAFKKGGNLKKGDTIGNWTVADFDRKEESNFKAIVYENGDTIAIVYVGTDFGFQNILSGDPGSVKDLGANLKMAVGSASRQMEQAEIYCRDIKQAYADSGKNIIVIGHSQGGSEAIYAGTIHSVPVYTFNAFGVSEGTFRRANYNIDFNKANGNITNYRGSRDIVSKARDPQGETYVVQSDYQPLAARKNHGIATMPDLQRSVPREQWRQGQRTPLTPVNYTQSPQMNINQTQNDKIMRQMLDNEAFLRSLSPKQLEIMLYAHLVGSLSG